MYRIATAHVLARIVTAVVLALAAAGLLCSQALGDADPASDMLLAADAFYPYSPPVSASLQAALNAETAAAAHDAHFPVKVAIIATPEDLGAIPQLFGKPQQYAAFLDQEISFSTKVPLLVVMPNGYGTAGVPSTAAAAIAALGRPPAASGNSLTEAAIAAVRKLAVAAGHPLGAVSKGSASGAGGSDVALPLAILVVACVAVAAAILTLRRRRAASAVRRR